MIFKIYVSAADLMIERGHSYKVYKVKQLGVTENGGSVQVYHISAITIFPIFLFLATAGGLKPIGTLSLTLLGFFNNCIL